MDINELLDKVKKKLEITSDYRLSKLTGISEQDLSAYRKGTKIPDVYTCFKFAEILEISPSVMMARVQSHFNKNETKRLFFKRFFSIVGLWITLAQISQNYIGLIEIAYAHGNENNLLNCLHNIHYAKSFFDFLERFFERKNGKKFPILYV